MIDLPARKHMRLRNYDYSRNGLYFVTFCTYDKANIFGRIVGAIYESPASKNDELPSANSSESPASHSESACHIALSENGEILRFVIEQLPVRYLEMKIDKYIIMPNHVHLIIEIVNERDVKTKRAIRESPLQARSLLSKAIGYLKMNVSKRINSSSGRNIAIWQRSYHDHIIRSDHEYIRIWQYMDDNPIKWYEDKYYKA